jgi:fatty acid-binding protein DegV
VLLAIALDRVLDIPKSIAKEKKVYILPIPVYIDGKMYLDGVDITSEEFYRKFHPGVVLKTSAPSLKVIEEFYERIKSDGYDELLFFHVSPELTSVPNAIKLVASQIKGLKVHFFDTRQISIGGGFAVMRAIKLLEKGKSVKEIIDILKDFSKNVCVRFTVFNLEYLIKGGRLTKIEGLIGALLKKMTDDIVEHLRNRRRNNILAIGWGHSRMKEYALELKAILEKKLSDFLEEVPEFIHIYLPPVLACHSGPELFGCAAYGEPLSE